MTEPSDPTKHWEPLRWPASPPAAEVLRDWLKDMSQPLYAIELDLRGADLSNGIFTESWFSGSDLRTTSLRGTGFWAAHCERTRFASADLAGADFVKAHLIDADFADAVLTHADFTRATAWRACFKHADLRHARLVGASFNGADFTGANLAGAIFEKTALPGAVFVNANLAGATGSIFGPVTVAPGTSLEGDDLQRWLDQQGVKMAVIGIA
jgi:uncharacterized protein YjbI with pentapeptide repeats